MTNRFKKYHHFLASLNNIENSRKKFLFGEVLNSDLLDVMSHYYYSLFHKKKLSSPFRRTFIPAHGPSLSSSLSGKPKVLSTNLETMKYLFSVSKTLKIPLLICYVISDDGSMT